MHPAFNNRMMRTVLFVVFVMTMGLFWTSCRNENEVPKVSEEKIVLNVRRFDRDLAALDTAHIAAGLPALKQKYPDFLDFWLDNLMQFGVRGHYADTSIGIRENLHTFLTYKDFRGLFDTVAKHFPDTKSIDEPLRKGFAYYKSYFPQRSIPKVVYFVSGLNNWSAITVDTEIVGIGLDMFLGETYPFYKSVGIPAYMYPQLRPENAPVFAFRAIYQDKHPFEAENRTLLDMMVQRGKEQYFLSKMLPFIPDEARLGFTKAQLDWCGKNEAMVYNFFVKGNMLYETNWGKIIRYVNDGPTAAGMPEESPGNVGSWLGWQIVKAYAAKHPKMNMEELFAMKDAQTILQDSGYKPR
jgi:hypothetical protein